MGATHNNLVNWREVRDHQQAAYDRGWFDGANLNEMETQSVGTPDRRFYRLGYAHGGQYRTLVFGHAKKA